MKSPDRTEQLPTNGMLALQTVAMPKDTNPAGDIFGGWLLSEMDVAGGIVTSMHVEGRFVTVAVDAMKFYQPVLVGDLVSCYGSVVRIGRTSISIAVETWVRRRTLAAPLKVTEGTFTYVSIDGERRPTPIKVKS